MPPPQDGPIGSSPLPPNASAEDGDGRIGWRLKLDEIVDLMRDMSLQTDPQEMVKRYGARLRSVSLADGFVSLSRRGLAPPRYRITRSSRFKDEIDPWREPHKLPMLEGGLLGELLYSGEPRIIRDFCPMPADPGYEYISDMRSFCAIPHYDKGEVVNMVVQLSRRPETFDESRLPDIVWLSNLFGRATSSLVLSRQLREALDALDRELHVVAEIQRSLLPRELPRIPGLELAAHYQTSRWAGGDYYDFFDLRDGRWGILVADVAGHGTPAAVLMAILHALAHQFPGPATPPGRVLEHINRELTERYTSGEVTFVTAFYGVFDPRERTLSYANAGHPSPLVRDARTGIAGAISDAHSSIPLGINPDVSYLDQVQQLEAGDCLVLYTDGITEARGPGGQLLGEPALLDAISRAQPGADPICSAILQLVDRFTGGTPPTDDRTLVVARLHRDQ